MKTEHFNELTPAEAERLAILAEECAEVIQMVGKILRHGYESTNPDATHKGTNREQLARELGDLHAAEERMLICDDISEGEIVDAQREKFSRMTRYLHHQKVVTKSSVKPYEGTRNAPDHVRDHDGHR